MVFGYSVEQIDLFDYKVVGEGEERSCKSGLCSLWNSMGM
jgi:hypothetical protein